MLLASGWPEVDWTPPPAVRLSTGPGEVFLMPERVHQYSPQSIADLLAQEGITDCDVDHHPIKSHGFSTISPLVIKNPDRDDLYVYLQFDRGLGKAYFEVWTAEQGLIANDFGLNRFFALLKAMLPK